MFRHFDEPNKLKSLNLGFAEIEEMSDIPEETFKMLLGRMRQEIRPEWKNFQYRILGIQTPKAAPDGFIRRLLKIKKKITGLLLRPARKINFCRRIIVKNLSMPMTKSIIK